MAEHWDAIFSLVVAFVIGLLTGRMFWPWRMGATHTPGAALFSGAILRRITLHEAGHAVAAWSCTNVVKLFSVSIDAEGGECCHASSKSESTDSMWCKVVISLAGLAAETTEFPKIRSGYAMDDLAKARRHAEKCIGSEPPWQDPGGKTLPFASMMAPPLTLDEERVLSIGYRMAKHVVAAHGDRVSKLGSLVAARGSVGETEMKKLFGARTFIALSGMFRSTFVLPKQSEERAA